MTRLRRFVRDTFFRKPTTLVHVGAGVLVALLLASRLWLLGLVLFCGFGLFEYWECARTGDSGHMDYWELLLGMFLTAAVLVLR